MVISTNEFTNGLIYHASKDDSRPIPKTVILKQGNGLFHRLVGRGNEAGEAENGGGGTRNGFNECAWSNIHTEVSYV